MSYLDTHKEATALTDANWEELAEMLRYRRPHLSKTERKFINRFLWPLGGSFDGYGNYRLQIGEAPRVMWCAHTDTVHKTGGKQAIAARDGVVCLHSSETVSNCLGADNTAGVWILCELIRAKVPGLYVFHRGEELGRLGSEWIAKNDPALLDGIDIAIAFDRRSTGSVITHQWNGRTCSGAFARSFIDATGLNLALDDGGTFTDTASYSDILSECTNISVGFDHEHSRRETLNVAYLSTLRDALLRADWSKLVVDRKPGEDDPWTDRWSNYGPYSSTPWDDDGLREGDDYVTGGRPSRTTGRDMASLISDYPALVADILEQYGYDYEMLADEMSAMSKWK